MSNGITNSIVEEIAENIFNKGKWCPFCNHDKISKYGKYHGKNIVKQGYKWTQLFKTEKKGLNLKSSLFMLIQHIL